MKIGRLWLIVAAACIVPAILDGVVSYIQARLSNRIPGWQEIFWQSNEWLILGALTPIAYYLAQRFPLRPPIRARNLFAHAGGALLLCIGWASAGASLRWVLDIAPEGVSKSQQMANWLLTTIPWGTFMYFTLLGCIHAFGYFVEAKEGEARAARLAAQVAESRLGALRTQLHPHFLFNSLNAITVLVRDKDTSAAARMLDLLSDVLRQVLKSDQAHVVSLAEELAFLERYLAIEQIRFSDRLQVRFDVDDSLKDAAVPVFILQPLVENALRHGIAKRADGGVVEVSARRDGESLILTIADNGRGLNRASGEHTDGNGLGLANIRERLTTLYGNQARLDLRPAPQPGGGTLAEVVIPYRQLDALRQAAGRAESPISPP